MDRDTRPFVLADRQLTPFPGEKPVNCTLPVHEASIGAGLDNHRLRHLSRHAARGSDPIGATRCRCGAETFAFGASPLQPRGRVWPIAP
jgi:hypothetical protein